MCNEFTLIALRLDEIKMYEYIKVQDVLFTGYLVTEMGTAVQILNIRDCGFSCSLLFRFYAHLCCWIEDTQQERAQLSVAGFHGCNSTVNQ